MSSQIPTPAHPRAVIAEKYELVELVAEGGMGSIWRARHLLLGFDVAVKLIRNDLRREDIAQRLIQEARAAARLGHPAIVRVMDAGRTHGAEGAPFLVMELLQGSPLSRLIDQAEELDPVFAIQILLPIADALCAAHEQGIVHRDLKPDNVFLARETHGTQPKLLDFGIAMFEHEYASRRLTQVGTVVGSPDYMSPEQAAGEALDHRTDIWSFSVMLYECITGTIPFRATNYHAQLRAILEKEPSGSKIKDPELWRIIRCGLHKKKELRFPTMSELGHALAEWLLLRGVREDICGASIETRWCVHGSKSSALLLHPSSLSPLERTTLRGSRDRKPKSFSEKAFPLVRSRRVSRAAILFGAVAALAVTGFARLDARHSAASQRRDPPAISPIASAPGARPSEPGLELSEVPDLSKAKRMPVSTASDPELRPRSEGADKSTADAGVNALGPAAPAGAEPNTTAAPAPKPVPRSRLWSRARSLRYANQEPVTRGSEVP